MSVPPAFLDRCGRTIAAAPEVAFAAAVSGTQNLVASMSCANYEDLYCFITTRLATLPNLIDVDVVPTIAVIESQGSTCL